MKFIPDAVTAKVARQILISQKHAPAVLFGTGIAGVVSSTVLACKATLSLEGVIQKAANDVVRSERMLHDAPPEEYTQDEHVRVLRTIKRKAAVEIATLYAPSILLGAASIAALTSAHGLLSKRNAALTAAYAGIDRAFKEYRGRVREEYGVEKEHALRFPRVAYEVENEGGKKPTKVTQLVDPAPSDYAKFFDRSCGSWSSEAEGGKDYNLQFLKCQEVYANQLLRARGHVFLNEVYDALGITRTRAGQIVGWVIDSRGEEVAGDGYIDFGLYDGPELEDGVILLDFNVDGNVLNLIEKLPVDA